MANCHELFSTFNDELKILSSKKDKMITSKDNLRKVIRDTSQIIILIIRPPFTFKAPTN